MAQRFILNGTSYHGKGAIKEIATEAISRGLRKHLYVLIQTLSSLVLLRKFLMY